MLDLLFIDDDVRLSALLTPSLESAGFSVTYVENGKAAMAQVKARSFDVILLDLMLPDTDGLTLFKAMREKCQTPVLMLTAKGDVVDKIIGLELGADDYLAKPFETRELTARLKAISRRVTTQAQERLKIDFIEIDETARLVYVKGEEKQLTAYQFDLLKILMQRAGRVMSREQLADLVRGDKQNYDPSFDRSIDIHIGKIRQAIEDDVKNPRLLQTIRGVGYVFKKGL